MKAEPKFDIEIQTMNEKHFNCYIPSISTYFFAKDFNDIKRIAEAMIVASVSYWNKVNRES